MAPRGPDELRGVGGGGMGGLGGLGGLAGLGNALGNAAGRGLALGRGLGGALGRGRPGMGAGARGLGMQAEDDGSEWAQEHIQAAATTRESATHKWPALVGPGRQGGPDLPSAPQPHRLRKLDEPDPAIELMVRTFSGSLYMSRGSAWHTVRELAAHILAFL